MMTGQMATRPVVFWEGDRTSLYTVMLVDQGIERLEGKQFIHWMVTNIPGTNVRDGAEVMQYIEPFSFEIGSDGRLDPNGPKHPILFLVYKQSGKIEMEEIQRGCSPSILSDRVNDKDDLSAKYNMKLVAGTFFQVPYSPGPRGTDYYLCRFTKCTKSAFPTPLPGVNDRPDCSPTELLLGQFWKGPKESQLAEYGKTISVFNPEAITSVIRSTKRRGISTGVSQEFNALYGTFKAPANPEGNLETTLEGDIGVDFFEYQSLSAAKRLFVGPDKLNTTVPELLPAVINALPTFAGDNFYHIAVGLPDDQDFRVRSLLGFPEEFPYEKRTNEVMWIQLANVKPGMTEKYLELRKKLLVKLANSPRITAYYTFSIPRGVGPLVDQYGNDQTEMLIYKAKSAADQQAWLGEILQSDPEFITEFLSTYDCTACAAVNTQLLPEYFPPFKV